MEDNELLEKVTRTTEVGAGGGGLLNAEQANRFIDYMFNATVLGQQVDKIRMRGNDIDIDKVAVGSRISRLATEAVDDAVNAAATFTKVSLTTKKIRLDWEISTEALEDNIEGEGLADHIARLMGTQLGNDLEDLAINGNTALTGDALLKSFNGYRKLAVTSGHVVDAAGAAIGRPLFNRALKTMPRKYMQQRSGLKFFTGSNLMQDYLFSLADKETTPEDIASAMIRNGPVRTEGPAGFVHGYAFGVPVSEVPLFLEDVDGDYASPTGDHGDILLTFPKNLLWGIKREIKINSEYKNKKDTFEYTAFVRFGVQIANADAVVIVKNVKRAA